MPHYSLAFEERQRRGLRKATCKHQRLFPEHLPKIMWQLGEGWSYEKICNIGKGAREL